MTFRTGNPHRGSLRRVLGFAAAVVATLVTGCKDSNDVTGTTSPASPPTANIAGAWVGVFAPSEPAFYYAEPVTAHANLQQTGANVDGTVDMSGFPTETIHVTVSGTRVNGTTEDASGAGTAVGVLVGARLSIVLHPHLASNAGQLGLHR